MNRTRRRRGLWQSSWPDHAALTATVSQVVSFHDADPTGMAWHGNYFRYYDAARVAVLGKLDFGYRQMADIKQIWPIVETQVRYLKSARFGSTLNVKATLVEWEFRLRFHYELTDEDGATINEAVTVQVPVDARDESLIVGSPATLIQRVEHLIAEQPQ